MKFFRCPICQEKVKLEIIERETDGNYQVVCHSCNFSGPIKTSAYDALEAWNKTMNCMKCPSTEICTYQKCNMKYLNGMCQNESCDLLEGRHLKGLPDYCYLKDEEPYNCHLLCDVNNRR